MLPEEWLLRAEYGGVLDDGELPRRRFMAWRLDRGLDHLLC